MTTNSDPKDPDNTQTASEQEAALALLLSGVESAHRQCLENSRSLDNKGAILLALLGVLLVVAREKITLIYVWTDLLMWTTLAGSFVASGLALWALRLRPMLIPPKVKRLRDLYDNKVNARRMAANLVAVFEEAVATNEKFVASKAKLINVAYWIMFFSLSAFVTSSCEVIHEQSTRIEQCGTTRRETSRSGTNTVTGSETSESVDRRQRTNPDSGQDAFPANSTK